MLRRGRSSMMSMAVVILVLTIQPVTALTRTASCNAASQDPATSVEQSAPPSTASESIVGTIQVTGDIPPMSPIPVTREIRSNARLTELNSSLHLPVVTKLPNESFLVSKEGYLANALVYLKRAPQGDIASPPAEPVVVTNDPLRFSPRVAVLRVGQPLLLKNTTMEPIDFHGSAIRNNGFNLMVGAEDQFKISVEQFKVTDSIPMTIQSHIQPWKQWTHLLVLDHPFAAVTDADGQFKIRGLPPGEHEFIVWHERAGFLNKKQTIVVKQDMPTKVSLKYDVARFVPAKLNEGRSIEWVHVSNSWSVGVSWVGGSSEFSSRDKDRAPRFQLMLRNETDEPFKINVPESINWDFGIQADRQLNVRLHNRGESIVTLAAREVKVLEVPNPRLDLEGIDSGYWRVRFTVPFGSSIVDLDLWLDAPPPAWVASQSLDFERAAQHPDDKFKDVRWGQALQGLRLGVRIKADPSDSLLHDARRRGRLRVAWPDNEVVKLIPEFFLWNTTSAEVEVSMLHHGPSDWGHRISRNNGPDVSPMDELGGPKFEEGHRLKPNGIVSLGQSSLDIVPSGSEAKLELRTVKLPPSECGYWSFLNVHRIDQPLLNLHLKSGLVLLVDGLVRD